MTPKEAFETQLNGVVELLVHDPGRGAPLALIKFENGQDCYIASPEGTHEGQHHRLQPEREPFRRRPAGGHHGGSAVRTRRNRHAAAGMRRQAIRPALRRPQVHRPAHRGGAGSDGLAVS